MDQPIAKTPQENIDEILTAIGRFAVLFEILCNSLRASLVVVLKNQGVKNDSIGFAFTARLTAGPLVETWGAAMSEAHREHAHAGQLLPVIHALANELGDIVTKRNNIIHGAWLIGAIAPGIAPDFSTARGQTLKRTRKGVELKSVEWTAKDFNDQSARAAKAAQQVSRLVITILTSKPVAEVLRVEKDGSVTTIQ